MHIAHKVLLTAGTSALAPANTIGAWLRSDCADLVTTEPRAGGPPEWVPVEAGGDGSAALRAVEARLHAVPAVADPRRVSAEYSLCHALRTGRQLSSRPMILVVATDTFDGRLAAACVRSASWVERVRMLTPGGNQPTRHSKAGAAFVTLAQPAPLGYDRLGPPVAKAARDNVSTQRPSQRRHRCGRTSRGVVDDLAPGTRQRCSGTPVCGPGDLGSPLNDLELTPVVRGGHWHRSEPLRRHRVRPVVTCSTLPSASTDTRLSSATPQPASSSPSPSRRTWTTCTPSNRRPGLRVDSCPTSESSAERGHWRPRFCDRVLRRLDANASNLDTLDRDLGIQSIRHSAAHSKTAIHRAGVERRAISIGARGTWRSTCTESDTCPVDDIASNLLKIND